MVPDFNGQWICVSTWGLDAARWRGGFPGIPGVPIGMALGDAVFVEEQHGNHSSDFQALWLYGF